MVDIPNLKLAKVGKDREKKRGGGGWWSARGAGAGFEGALAADGGFMGTGMSLAKLLTILLVSGGLSAGAWEAGNMIAARSAANARPNNNKLFADKDAGKYADTSDVIKSQNTIPNSLGYVNDDGLTDEQRAAKKAAEEEAARKAAADAQAKADADAKAKADADAKAKADADKAAASNSGAEPAGMMKKSLSAGKFGSMNSSFGGGGLSGGAGLSGGINGKFAPMNNTKAQNGALSGFGTSKKPSMSTAKASSPVPKSGLKGFAGQQLGNTFQASRSALATGQTESAATGAAAPFDNNPSQGSVISGPGVSDGVQTGGAGNATTPNTPNDGGPTGGGSGCSASGTAPDANGNCSAVSSPTMVNAAPYQGLIDAVMILMGIVMILSLIATIIGKSWLATTIAHVLCGIVAALGVVIAGIGAMIATMKNGDFMIGGIIGVVGAFIAGAAIFNLVKPTTTAPQMLLSPAAVLIASSLGELAAGSKMISSLE